MTYFSWNPKGGKHFCLLSFLSPNFLLPFHKYLSCECSILNTVIGAWGTNKMQSGMNIIKTCFRSTVRMQCMSPGPLVNSYPPSQHWWFRSYLNELVVFPTFFNLSLNFAIRSSWSEPQSAPSFCWLYRASPSLAAKNIINVISVLTIWWCPCIESCLVSLLKEGVGYDQCVPLAKLY